MDELRGVEQYVLDLVHALRPLLPLLRLRVLEHRHHIRQIIKQRQRAPGLEQLREVLPLHGQIVLALPRRPLPRISA